MISSSKKIQRSKGFTLIELLVVISIISLLSSVVLAAVGEARDRAQKAGRLETVYQIEKALEIYRIDNNSFPNIGSTNAFCLGKSTGETCWGGNRVGHTALNSQLDPYIDIDAFSGTPDSVGVDYLYINGSIPLGSCSNNTVAGQYIIWRPEPSSAPSAATCPGRSVVSCCGSTGGLCGGNHAYFCAHPLSE